MQKIFILFILSALTGCSDFRDVFLPDYEKINKAFPVGAEIRVAEEKLQLALQGNKEELSRSHDQYSQRLRLRALTCSQNISIDRFDTVEKIKTLPVDHECMKEQDENLLAYLGIKQVGFRLSQAPLRPLAPLGLNAPVQPHGKIIVASYGASNAGVAILRDGIKGFISVEIPNGKKIADLPEVQCISTHIDVSPNGRIVAIPASDQGVFFFDTETGEPLWEGKSVNRFYEWLPGISAAVVGVGDNNKLSLIDFDSGDIKPHPLTIHSQSWSVSLENSASEILLGTASSFMRITHERLGNTIEATMVKTIRIPPDNMPYHISPFLIFSGKKVLFLTKKYDIAMTDIESEKHELINFYGFLRSKIAKIDEKNILAGSNISKNTKRDVWLIDLEHLNMAPIFEHMSKSDTFDPIQGRSGAIMRIGGESWFCDKVTAGPFETIESVASSFNLELQIAKLHSSKSQATPPRQGKAIDHTKNILATMAKVAQIEAVGVYESSANSPSKFGNHRMRPIEITVRRSRKPLILVLSSYEPVKWIINKEHGSSLLAVLTSGYYQSEVVGAGDARIVNIGRKYAYEFKGKRYSELSSEVYKYTEKPIDLFQGGYKASDFSVGGGAAR